MLTKIQYDALSQANSPEEAAQVFKREVSIALADVVAKALADATKSAATTTVSPKTLGWTEFVRGAAMSIDWDRGSALSTLPMLQVCSFANGQPDGPALAGWDVSIDIGIRATF